MRDEILAKSFRLIRKTATGARLGIILLRENIFVGAGVGALTGASLHLYFYLTKADFSTLGRYSIPIFSIIGLLIGFFSGMERKRTASLKEQTRVLLKEVREKERLIHENQSKTEELEDILVKLRQAQDRLIQEGKMASLGNLAAGIAHQLNQPLTAIRGFTQIILRKLGQEGSFSRELKSIETQTSYMMEVISNLGGFSRMADRQQHSCSFNQCVEEALGLLKDRLNQSQIEVGKKLRPDLPLVNISPNKMEQVLINFFINAQEAMEDLPPDAPRRLSLTTNLREQDPNRVEIVISDNGSGIPEKVKNRIFEAFFTTKGPSTLGLGLYLNYTIIHEQGGEIECESKENEGTTFRVILPAFLPPPTLVS